MLIITTELKKLTKTFLKLEKEAKEIGLIINEEKTKYMKLAAEDKVQVQQQLALGDYKFEKVNKFIYLGSEINVSKNNNHEINGRIHLGNKTYHANKTLLKSKILNHKSKIKIYKTLIVPKVTYSAETWTLTKTKTNYSDGSEEY